jgi:hypothetical protein
MFSESELSLLPSDDKLPLISLRERRRELVMSLRTRQGRIALNQIKEIAAVQQAIRAVEAVIAE